MNMKKTILQAAIASVVGFTAMTAQSATLNNGDILSIAAGVQEFDQYGNPTDVTVGSYFAMDFSGNSKISGTEKTPISGVGAPGVIIGATNTAGDVAGVYHGGPATAGDVGPVDLGWDFNNATGTDWFNTVAPTGDTTNGINFGGWTVAWNTLSNIPMTGGAWAVGNCAVLGCIDGSLATFSNGVANFSWDGVYGNAYQIDYTATVPAGDPSGFGGTQYFLRLTGTVTEGAPPIPIPAAVWLFGSGLLGLVGVARRRKST